MHHTPRSDGLLLAYVPGLRWGGAAGSREAMSPEGLERVRGPSHLRPQFLRFFFRAPRQVGHCYKSSRYVSNMSLLSVCGPVDPAG